MGRGIPMMVVAQEIVLVTRSPFKVVAVSISRTGPGGGAKGGGGGVVGVDGIRRTTGGRVQSRGGGGGGRGCF